LNKIEIDRP